MSSSGTPTSLRFQSCMAPFYSLLTSAIGECLCITPDDAPECFPHAGAVGADSVTLLALYEGRMADQDWDVVTQSSAATFGFAFLDAAAGRYYLGSVGDDAGRANLSSVITQVGLLIWTFAYAFEI